MEQLTRLVFIGLGSYMFGFVLLVTKVGKLDNVLLDRNKFINCLTNFSFKRNIQRRLKVSYAFLTTKVNLRSKIRLFPKASTIKNEDKQETSKNCVNKKIKPTLTTSNVKFLQVFDNVFVFSSYFDDRQEKKFIRSILIAKSGQSAHEKLWCHFWCPALGRWKISELDLNETCENHSKEYAAYIGSCEIPENAEYEYVYISNLEKTKIEEMTAIPVIKQTRMEEYTMELAVCVPPLFGNINPVRLLEFIEFSVILGFKHFTFYTHNIASELMTILKHYQNTGLVTIIDWSIVIRNEYIWYHGQSAAVWDCLYRNMFIFKYVAFIDIDEYIFPRNTETLTDFIRLETRNSQYISGAHSEICAFRFQSAFFDTHNKSVISKVFNLSKNTEKHLVTLNCLDRKSDFSKIRTKMIVDPTKIFELGIHHVSKPTNENFQVKDINPNHAFIHHYRECDNSFGERCTGNVRDEHVMRYKNRLLTNLKWRLYHISKELL